MLVSPLYAVVLAILLPFAAVAAPASGRRGETIPTLAASQIQSYTTYTWYANAAYCAPSKTLAWECGLSCNANPAFQPIAAGGDGSDVQFWFVGYDPALDTVIVSHQGTNPQAILPLLTDADIVLEQLDASLFPGVSSSVRVHSGFAREHSKTATAVLAAVQEAMSTYSVGRVTIVGHSLGAAVALLDAIYLPLHIPDASYTFVGYGLPRVGNQEFADYVDAHPIAVSHVNNRQDVVPILPGEFLGYVHPAGELHILNSGAWAACPGQDNSNTECIVGDVPTVFEGDTAYHDGPYYGITMSSSCSS